ncbi:MAG: hypothetical protein ABJD66_03825 [Cellulophaga sp.]|uniref:hypothetical protein n=1 Tax=unclassified Cellulophaga TaxID=2634405 RepID=UPI000C2BB08C|nr:hypothetical protein [Cellulophaga sp. RHA19]PKB41948.1 hypothetical protein AX016_0102 [Cellulophaga sp. RHA19]
MKEKFSKCIPYDKNIRGRIGGNPPILIEDIIPENYLFYATIVHPRKENYMLSILIHKDFDTRIEKNIYPNIEVKVIEHNYSEEGLLEEKRNNDISINSITNYLDKANENDFFIVKAGGTPNFIQHKDYYYKELNKDGYFYLLQIDEEGYSDDLLIDNYPFNYGALYLYEQNETKKIIAGFWQYS